MIENNSPREPYMSVGVDEPEPNTINPLRILKSFAIF